MSAGVSDPLDDGEQVKGRAGRPVYPRHRYNVAKGDSHEHPVQLVLVGACAAGRLVVDRAAAVRTKLVKVAVEVWPPVLTRA